MYIPTGVRHSAGLAASWLFLGVSLVASIVYYDELKAFTGDLIGLPELHEQVAGLRQRAAEVVQPESEAEAVPGSVTLTAGRDGHFHTEAEINGRSIEVLVDTGATTVALTWEDAQAAGIQIREADFTMRARTANGEAKVAPVTISQISIGEITVYDVRGTVMERGKMQTTLLGMSFLGRLSRAEMRRDTLILER